MVNLRFPIDFDLKIFEVAFLELTAPMACKLS